MNVVVAAAVVGRGEDYLVTRRVDGTHLAGLWEFPGGKCHEGESLAECLRRELIEELGTDATVGRQIYETSFEYPERTVTLHFFDCTLLEEPRPMLGQQMQWVHRDKLKFLSFPPADADLIRLLESVKQG